MTVTLTAFDAPPPLPPGFVRCALVAPRPEQERQPLDLVSAHGGRAVGWATRQFLRTLADRDGLVTYWVLPDGAARAICVEPLAWRVHSGREEPRP